MGKIKDDTLALLESRGGIARADRYFTWIRSPRGRCWGRDGMHVMAVENTEDDRNWVPVLESLQKGLPFCKNADGLCGICSKPREDRIEINLFP